MQQPPCQVADPLQDSDQVPASIVAGERVQLVDHDSLEILEELSRLRAAGDQHHLDRLGSGQQQVRPLAHDRQPPRGPHVAMPQTNAASYQSGVRPEPSLDVVQERLDRTDVEHAHTTPPFGQHP